MNDNIKNSFRAMVDVSTDELAVAEKYFEHQALKKKTFLLEQDAVCNFVAFLDSGTLRHFHLKNGTEITCDITTEQNWVTDYQSFTTGKPTRIFLQAMEDTVLYKIKRVDMESLFAECPKFETFSRKMAERIADKAIKTAISLASEKPEERFQNLLKNAPDLFQRIPQKYIANYIGISPESFSRMQRRILKKKKS